MEAKDEYEEIDDNTRYTEVDFSWPEVIMKRARNLVKEYKVIKRAVRIKKSSIQKDSLKSKGKKPPV